MIAQNVVNKFAQEINAKRTPDHKKVRREYLKTQQDQKYSESIGQFMNSQKQVMQQLMNVFIQVTQSDVNAFNRSGQFFSNQQNFREGLQKMQMQIAQEYETNFGKIIETEKCIEAVRRVEEAKISSIDMVTKYVRSGKIPQQAAPMIMEIDKCKALDKLFFDEGIEEVDLGRTVRECNLTENEQFKAMAAECQAKFMAV